MFSTLDLSGDVDPFRDLFGLSLPTVAGPAQNLKVSITATIGQGHDVIDVSRRVDAAA